jgi:glutamyl-Q tRNA(Asp) synthetase
LDTPRNVKGSAEHILKTLEIFGLVWDGCAAYQSQYREAYNDILNTITNHQLVYPCVCSRKTLAAIDTETSLSNVYPGTCRDRKTLPDAPYSLRIKTDNRVIYFHDELQGSFSDNMEKKHGDFIIKRRDQIIAYQFAVIIDDALQQINHVVRGVDLLESTPKQIYLQQILGITTPDYMHVPIIIDQYGYKLSKQTLATAVDTKNPQGQIFDLLVLLKQNPPQELKIESVSELLAWAVAHWNPTPLRNSREISPFIT